MPRPLLIFSQSDYLIQDVDINSRNEWQTVQIQISWLLKKPTDLDLHCFIRQGRSCLAREGLTAFMHCMNLTRNIEILREPKFFDIGVHKVATSSSFKTLPGRLGGSVGCAVRLETRRLGVQPPPWSATFFRGDWSWNIFYGHSLPSADSRRAVVSFWRKNVHNTG